MPSIRALRRAQIALPPDFNTWFFKITAVDPNHRFDQARHAIVMLAEALGQLAPVTLNGPLSARSGAKSGREVVSISDFPSSDYSASRSGAAITAAVLGPRSRRPRPHSSIATMLLGAVAGMGVLAIGAIALRVLGGPVSPSASDPRESAAAAFTNAPGGDTSNAKAQGAAKPATEPAPSSPALASASPMASTSADPPASTSGAHTKIEGTPPKKRRAASPASAPETPSRSLLLSPARRRCGGGHGGAQQRSFA